MFRLLCLLLLTLACASGRSSKVEPSAAPTTATSVHRAPAELLSPNTPVLLTDAPPPGDLGKSSRRLDFRGGDPRVPVRLMEGAKEITFKGLGPVVMRLGGPEGKELHAPQGASLRALISEATPAEVLEWIQFSEIPFADKEGLAKEERVLKARGLRVRTEILGGIYGIFGKVVDNRRYLVLLDEPLSLSAAKLRKAELLSKHGLRTSLHEEVTMPSSGTIELLDESGALLAVAKDQISAETSGGEGFWIQKVEFGVGYDFHGFEDRSYRGALQLSLDKNGALAAVNVVSLEELLYGLVPSEIFARAHIEALKAQAVTARGEVLAKIGTKHLSDPYLLCAEQHCAVYKGRSGEQPSTTAAVVATRGEALFSNEGRLVDSVYSAVCGGHTEDNEVVWGGPPNPSLRGRPDVITPASSADGQKQRTEAIHLKPTEADLDAYLSADLPAACRLSSFAQPSRYRWEKRFSAEELNHKLASLNLGALQAITVGERGVSGRAKVITLSGETGATQIRGELNIRRLFGMLSSAMFTVHPERAPDGAIRAWVFRGGGWGHGVGMCQTGAIGRAEAGQDYRTILRYYFNGAEVAKIY